MPSSSVNNLCCFVSLSFCTFKNSDISASVAEPLHFRAAPAPAPGIYFENPGSDSGSGSGSSFSSELLEIFDFYKFIVFFHFMTQELTSWALNVDYLYDIISEIQKTILSSEILIRMCRTVGMRYVNVKYYFII